MSKVSDMSLQAILNQIDIGFKQEDLNIFCNDKNVCNEIMFMVKENRDFKEVLLENEDKINKERLVLISYLTLKEKLENEDKDGIMSEQEKRNIKNSMLRIKKLAKGMDTYIAVAHKGKELIDWIEVISARNLIAGIPTLEKKNRKIFDSINKELASEEEIPGINFAIQCIEMPDFKEIVVDQEIDRALEYCISFNAKVKGKDFLDKMEEARNNHEDEDKIAKLENEFKKEILMPEITANIEGILGYIDLPKLLLISIYRFEDLMDRAANGDIEIDTSILESVEAISDKLLQYIEKNTKVSNDEYTYSYEDAKKFIKRIDLVNGVYFTQKEVDDFKERLINGEDISKLDEDEAFKLPMLDLSKEQLEEIMKVSPENFSFAAYSLKLSTKEILEKGIKNKEIWTEEYTKQLLLDGKLSSKDLFMLYANEMISSNFFKENEENIDINSEINLNKINQEYLNLANQKNEEQEKLRLLEKRIELFKQLKLKDKTEEELQESSDQLIYDMAEEIHDEDNVVFFYNKGLITLQTLAGWCNTETLDKLYKEGKITFEDIANLKIDNKTKQTIIGKDISSRMEEYEQEDLLRYINLGYLSEEDIYKAYKAALLNDTYAEDMLNKGIISAKTYIDILNIGKEELEKQTNTTASKLEKMQTREFVLNLMNDENMDESSLSIGSIPESKKDIITTEKEKKEQKGYETNSKKVETLIDPGIRWAFLKALKCKYPADRNFAHDNLESPFYDYEFFIIENKDENGEAQKDSIVIGERFFKDKNNQNEFATSNATYIWQYKDYLIAKKLTQGEKKKNKKAVTQETEGVVYKTFHKAGSWAISLIYKIAQAKAGKSFDEYRGDERASKALEQLEKLYSPEEIKNILDIAKIIDDEQEITNQNGEKIGLVYEVINEEGRVGKKKVAPEER